MNLAHHLRRAGLAYGERPAVAVGQSVHLCYQELAARTAALAASMRDAFGLKPGDRVALVMPNRPEYLEILYACWHAGLVAVPVNAKLHANEFHYILADCDTRAVFATTPLAETVGALDLPNLKFTIDVDSLAYRMLFNEQPMEIVSRAPDDPAWVFYTSGTTGKPKGATLSHRNLLAAIFCYFADVDQGAPWRSILHAAPLSHGSGLYGLAHVTQASCHVIPESSGFDPMEIKSLIAHWPRLSLFAAPTMAKRLIDHDADLDLSNLKSIIYGGGPMYQDDLLRGIDRFGPRFAQLYGQGESPMTITALSSAAHADVDHPRYRSRLASAGTAQSVVEVRVADADDASVQPGEAGEILVRGDSVMLGYWNNPDATAETLSNGWLHTGDIGAMDEDGFLTLRDRSKDMIISGGSNIYPREIEEILMTHADVHEASVIGVADPEWGESVVAYIVANAASDAKPTEEQLDRHVLSSIARYKRPRRYRFVEQLPKNNYGKILKTELRQMESDAEDENNDD